jgi:electron transport complex protein RnfB
MLTIITIALAAAVVLVLAIAMSSILGWASRKFHVPVDLRIDEINNALPAANCGGCGYVGCAEYAEAVVNDGVAPDLCPVGGSATTEAIGKIMGIEVSDSHPQRPVVHCVAKRPQRLKQHEYRGEMTCHGANMVAGIQGCPYGCLGYGDCVNVCDYDAIHIVDGLATIDYQKCIGCGACTKVCPRNIISSVPFKSEQILAVQCSNKDFGKEVQLVCQWGCIGCRACTRIEKGLLTIEDNLAKMNWDKYDPAMKLQDIQNRCPREAMVWIGKPTAADIANAGDQEIPQRVEADFKTTVDDAEWRG